MTILVLTDRPAMGAGMARVLRDGLQDPDVRCDAVVDHRRMVPGTTTGDLVVVDLTVANGRARVCGELADRDVPVVAVIEDADQALQLFQLGVGGVVTSHDRLDGLVHAATTVTKGRTHVPPGMLSGVLHRLIEYQRRQDARSHSLRRLSPREREVLRLLGDGHDQGTIARELSISPQTAKTHIRNVRNKLGVRSRIEAAAVASEMGLSWAGGRP